MDTLDATVTVTLELPQTLYERVAEEAQREQRTPENVLENLVADRFIDAQARARAAWERASALYRARLEREGKLDQTPEEIFAELAAIREEIANELYPD